MNEHIPFAIPKTCVTCPKVIEYSQHINRNEAAIDQLIHQSVGPELEETIQLAYDIAKDSPEGLPENTSPEAIAQDVRAADSEEIEYRKERISTALALMAHHTLDCLGPDVIRTKKYELTVCNSPAIVPNPIEAVSVKRLPSDL